MISILKKLSRPWLNLNACTHVCVSHLVLGVEHHSLRVWHADHVVVEGGGGQPDAGRQFVVEQGQLRDQPLGLLLLGGQCGQALADAHQGLDELSLGSQPHRLVGCRYMDGWVDGWMDGCVDRTTDG